MFSDFRRGEMDRTSNGQIRTAWRLGLSRSGPPSSAQLVARLLDGLTDRLHVAADATYRVAGSRQQGSRQQGHKGSFTFHVFFLDHFRQLRQAAISADPLRLLSSYSSSNATDTLMESACSPGLITVSALSARAMASIGTG